MSIYDLLYCGDHNIYESVKADVLAHYPDAVIEDASDDIHEYRFSVTVEVANDDWIMFMLEAGCMDISLMTQMMSMDTASHEKFMAMLREAVRRVKEREALA